MNKKILLGLYIAIKSYFNFFFTKKNKKKIIFFSEGLSHNQFYLSIVDKLNEDSDVLIITNQIENYFKLKNDYQIYYFGNSSLLKFVLDNINCHFFFTTTPDLGENFKLSPNCNEYIYLFHSLASCNKIYKKNAFNNYDTICANGYYQINELKKMEVLYNLKKKKYLKTGYPLLNYLFSREIKPKSKSLTKILIAPTWSLDNETFFNSFCEQTIQNLLLDGFKVILRPHPENIKRSKKLFNKLSILSNKSDFFEIDVDSSNFDAMNNSDILITDYSTISLEFMYRFHKPVIFINSKEKIHNEEYKKIIDENFEDKIRKICKNINVYDLRYISEICRKEFTENNVTEVCKLIKGNLFLHESVNEVIHKYIKEVK